MVSHTALEILQHQLPNEVLGFSISLMAAREHCAVSSIVDSHTLVFWPYSTVVVGKHMLSYIIHKS